MFVNLSFRWLSFFLSYNDAQDRQRDGRNAIRDYEGRITTFVREGDPNR